MAAETNPGQVDYPYPYSEQPFEPGKDGWKKQSLYGIVGWYTCPDGIYGNRSLFDAPIKLADLLMSFSIDQLEIMERDRVNVEKTVGFAGFFKMSQEGLLNGLIVDPLGASKMRGEQNPEGETLKFRKTYDRKLKTSVAAPVPIDYEFSRDKETGLWKGRYHFYEPLNQNQFFPDYELQASGQAVCQTFLFHDNAFGIHTSLIEEGR